MIVLSGNYKYIIGAISTPYTLSMTVTMLKTDPLENKTI